MFGLQELPSNGAMSDKGKLQEEGEVIQQRKVDSDLQWRGLVCGNCRPMGLGVRIEIKVLK
jgi:hypothetical protein